MPVRPPGLDLAAPAMLTVAARDAGSNVRAHGNRVGVPAVFGVDDLWREARRARCQAERNPLELNRARPCRPRSVVTKCNLRECREAAHFA
jgi:hypothetical protein